VKQSPVLTLTRWPVKAGNRPPAESTIVIRCPGGTEVRVLLVDVQHTTQAEIGIDAPPEYQVYREELVKGVQRQGAEPAADPGRAASRGLDAARGKKRTARRMPVAAHPLPGGEGNHPRPSSRYLPPNG
jgi:sRNA-binding carbon storage regulator CsrA